MFAAKLRALNNSSILFNLFKMCSRIRLKVDESGTKPESLLSNEKRYQMPAQCFAKFVSKYAFAVETRCNYVQNLIKPG